MWFIQVNIVNLMAKPYDQVGLMDLLTSDVNVLYDSLDFGQGITKVIWGKSVILQTTP